MDLLPPYPTPENSPNLLLEQEFDAGLGGFTVLTPAPEGRAGTQISYPGPNARLACVLHRDEVTAYAVAAGGAWQYLFTADVGRFARLDDPAVRAQYRYGFGVRVDAGTFSVERFAVRRR